MDSRKPEVHGIDVESPAGPDYPGRGPTYAEAYGKDTSQVAHRGAAAHMGPVSPTPPGVMTTELHPVFGDQMFNIQWVLMIFWLLVVPSLVAVFLPLCNAPGRRFPTVSYKRGWIGNLILSIVLVILWVISIVASVSDYQAEAEENYTVHAEAPAPAPATAGGTMG